MIAIYILLYQPKPHTMTPDTRFTIYGWMGLYLHINGNERMAYAFIFNLYLYGREYTAPASYMAGVLGITRNNARLILESLTKKNLITKLANPDGITYAINPTIHPIIEQTKLTFRDNQIR